MLLYLTQRTDLVKDITIDIKTTVYEQYFRAASFCNHGNMAPQWDADKRGRDSPSLAPFLRKQTTTAVLRQPMARSSGRMPLLSVCSTTAPLSSRY